MTRVRLIVALIASTVLAAVKVDPCWPGSALLRSTVTRHCPVT